MATAKKSAPSKSKDLKTSAKKSTPAVSEPLHSSGPLRLSLACGDRKPEGFKGVDIARTAATDYVQDLMQFPWTQFADNSVDEIEVSHYVEHIPHGDGFNDPFFQFFDEIYRILKPAEFDPNNPNIPLTGIVNVSGPYYSSVRAIWDPTHLRSLSEQSFLYTNKQWRIDNLLDHYPISCDFDFSYGYVLDPDWQNRSQESQAFAIKHYINVVTDIQVQLVKRSPEK